MAVLYTQHFVQFFDNNGNPASNGRLFAYSAGTTTPKSTFKTEAGDVEHTHPIQLDAAGMPDGASKAIFIEGSYRFDLELSGGQVITTDNVNSFTALNETGDPFFQSFSGNGSTTVFTLSESLGNNSKDIMVFVDAGGNEGYDIQNPSDYTLSGTSLTFDTAPASGTDNIYVFAPTKLLGAASASAAAAAASEAAAASSASEAEAAAGLLKISSTTSLAIGTGSKVFTVGADLGLTAGQFVIAVSDADVGNYMFGQITSYSTTSLTVDVEATGGSGTYGDWTITLMGLRGLAGTVSTTSGVTAATSAGASLISSGSNVCLSWGSGGGANTTLGGNMSGASTHKLVNMADGTSAQDYVTKAQLDALGSSGAEIALVTAGGYGSTGTSTIYFTTVETNNGGSDLTYTSSSVNGDSITINTTGVYAVSVEWVSTATGREFGATRNASSTSTNITALAVNQQICVESGVNDIRSQASRVLNLTSGDVIRLQTDKGATSTMAGDCRLSICKVG